MGHLDAGSDGRLAVAGVLLQRHGVRRAPLQGPAADMYSTINSVIVTRYMSRLGTAVWVIPGRNSMTDACRAAQRHLQRFVTATCQSWNGHSMHEEQVI